MSLTATAEHLPAVPDASPFPSAEQKRLIRESFVRIEPAIDLVAQLFLRRLRDLAPDLKFVSTGGPEDHRRLITALRLAVASLDRLDDVLPAVRLLGVTQRSAGVNANHYGAAGEALLWTLQKCLKGHFSAEAYDAWVAFYTLLAETMYMAGAKGARTKAS
jgi:hemoglobin-like flavoprotein